MSENFVPTANNNHFYQEGCAVQFISGATVQILMERQVLYTLEALPISIKHPAI